GRVAPQAGGGEHLLVWQAEPGAGLGAAFALGLGEGAERDQAAALGEAVAPHKAVELVGAGVVDRFRLERLAVPALQHQRKTPGHRAQLAGAFCLAHYEARAAGEDLAHARVADLSDDRVEQVGDFVVGPGQAVEVAHVRCPTAFGCLRASLLSAPRNAATLTFAQALTLDNWNCRKKGLMLRGLLGSEGAGR